MSELQGLDGTFHTAKNDAGTFQIEKIRDARSLSSLQLSCNENHIAPRLRRKVQEASWPMQGETNSC